MSGGRAVTARRLPRSTLRRSPCSKPPTIANTSSDESEIASVYAASVEDVDTAVSAARKAFNDPSWRDISPTDRGNLLITLSDLVGKHADTLATIETWDNGKVYADALGGDVAEVQGVLKYYGGYADKIHGQTIDVGPAKFAYTIKEPVGVCGQIIPWNYPLAMAAWKLGPALACGNTIVIKAAEQTPLSILYLAELIKEAGFPPGVVNILNGYGREAGAAIATHLGIDKVAFTGSTGTGKEIMKMAAVNMKNITLETGGKSPLLVFDDADLKQAVKWAHIGKIRASLFRENANIFQASCRTKDRSVLPLPEFLSKNPSTKILLRHSRSKFKNSQLSVTPSPRPLSKAPKSQRLNTNVCLATSKSARKKVQH
jgi:acyl-CoA reductase-like NAD-dependent aldehyde dehydrogenase